MNFRSDFISMVPTSFAYAGVLSGNQSYVEEAYHQIKLYRNYLRDANAGNLWHHIVYGWWDDAGHWTTGETAFSGCSMRSTDPSQATAGPPPACSAFSPPSATPLTRRSWPRSRPT